jgi:hypothetical protein
MATLEDALSSIKDDSLQAAKAQLQSLLQQAKAEGSEFAQDNATMLEQWLVQLSEGKLNKTEFDALVDDQRALAEEFVNTQEIAGRNRARDLTLNVLDIAAQKIAPVLISSLGSGGKTSGSS